MDKKKESYIEREKRKKTGSEARKRKREEIKKKLNNIGIFKELRNVDRKTG